MKKRISLEQKKNDSKNTIKNKLILKSNEEKQKF